MESLEIGIIGLGKFGYFLAQRMMELGHDVVGLDSNPDFVRRAQDDLTRVFQGDGTDRTVLEQLGFQNFSNVVVSVGAAMEASILICLHLKELGVPNVWVKAISWEHEKVLTKIGADEVFFPERYGAQQLALRMTHPGLIDYLPFGMGVLIQQLTVDNWAGQTLRQLDLTNKYRLQVVAIRHHPKPSFEFLPQADTMLQKGDELVIFVQEEMLKKIKP
ncbi:potassium channel family protein [Desulfobaculum bizertense]|uniref:Trk system potassium uptake protein TrkA n=1 Tax=Desulfobaculum bizertense DSM 18034 TaxID=1121442 RepID=A0A1T4W2Y9_9BACT|nr:TrkA family potassium uptake protein [Desulfobaculum bizertense]UIJ38807.1 TrkA family potassium uptake protein [Desulfobaculum bizertense]SKA71593.1 trk system potassium uptake protein TrkA [Desulfobaculum bizertense DSM 18034]